MNARPTKAEHHAAVMALAHRMVDIVSEQPTHQVALEALISAYASVAVCHPCCQQQAADLARRVADVLDLDPAAPPHAPHVH